MNTCRTCKHWKRDRATDFGHCEKILVDIWEPENNKINIGGLQSGNQHNDAGYILVGRQFGCIHHNTSI